MIVSKNIRDSVNDWVTHIPNWTHCATLRGYYKLNYHNTDKLMDKLFKYQYIYQIFWVLENDTTGYNHLHLLLGSTLLGENYDVKNKLNRYLGGKQWDYFKYVDQVKPNDLHKYVGYCTKKIDTNNGYGVLM